MRGGGITRVIIISLFATLACAGIIKAATTIGTNISTGGTLDVTGVSTLTGNTNIAGSLTSSGSNTLYGATSIGGALTATSTLTVNGATILYGALTAYGNTTLSNLTATGTLSVTGLTTLENASTTLLTVSGNTYLATTTINGNNIATPATLVVCSSSALDKGNCDYVCDGTADNIEIQAAITAIETNNKGGVIYLSEGIFYIADTITITKGNIRLMGAEVQGTTLSLVASTNKDMISLDAAANQYFVTIERIQMSGNRAAQGAGQWDCIQADEYFNDVYIKNVFITNCKSAGIRTALTWGWVIDQTVIEYAGLGIVASISGSCVQCTIKISGSKIIANYGNGISLTAVSDAIISGNIINEGSVDGNNALFLSNSANAIIIGNTFGSEGGVDSKSIWLAGTSNYPVITGNYFSGYWDSALIQIASGIVSGVITNNIFQTVNLPINFSGTPTDFIIENNTGTNYNFLHTAATVTSLLYGVTQFDTTSNAIAASLANGFTLGQMKTFRFKTDGGNNVTITPASFSDGTSITMDDANDFITLQWTGAKWKVVTNVGCTVNP